MTLKEITLEDLEPMSEAPRDGSSILAYNKYTKSFHLVFWIGEAAMWTSLKPPHWGNKWDKDYSTYDADFLGWTYLPVIVEKKPTTIN